MKRGFAAVGLYHPKTPANVGSVMRAAQCFGASLVIVTGKRLQPGATDTFKTWRHTPLLHVDEFDLRLTPHGAVPVCVEVGGTENLYEFNHPERAFYIFGPEDGSIPRQVMDRCPLSIRIPSMACLNLAMSANLVLSHRAYQRKEVQ